MKISFYSHANKTNFLIKSFVLSLAIIMRFTATRKWSNWLPRPRQSISIKSGKTGTQGLMVCNSPTTPCVPRSTSERCWGRQRGFYTFFVLSFELFLILLVSRLIRISLTLGILLNLVFGEQICLSAEIKRKTSRRRRGKNGKKRREKVKGKVETFPLTTGLDGSDK